MLTATMNDKLVILHSGVGRWRRGDVVSPEDLGGDVDRLLAHQAVRVAYPQECDHKHVDLPDGPQEVSHQKKLADKDQLVSALRSQIHELQQQLSVARPSGPAVNAAALEQAAAMLRQKDAIILELQTKLHQMETTTNSQAGQAQELAELKHKLATYEAGTAEIQARIAAVAESPAPRKGK